MEHSTQKSEALWSIRPPETAEQSHLAEDLTRITQRMREVEGLFNLCGDPDLTEAYIYEMRALNARYSSVLKQARGEGMSAET
ncbi:MAG: hypothetical protein ACERKO_02835 [Acetanaerobacterium sp.]